MNIIPETKRLFLKKGTCSQLFFFLINREFGEIRDAEERASDQLAGGMMRGHQCGMLWGSSLAAGAESFRRYGNSGKAIHTAITATREISHSFLKRAKSVNCCEITNCDLSNKWGMRKMMVKVILRGFIYSQCFNFAKRWAPDAIKTAKAGLANEYNNSEKCLSCASEVITRLGGKEEEVITAAGFAGGLGLSGNGCGALAAAIWMNSLKWCRENPGKSGYLNPATEEILKAFSGLTGGKFKCREICGLAFSTVDEHTEFINNGGCKDLLEMLGSKSISPEASLL